MDSYFKQIKNHELLNKDQEIELAQRYRRDNDQDAADRLVMANLRLVVKIARDYYYPTAKFSQRDLIQQGNMGLVQAVYKFDPERNTKFSYYASFWIKAHILKYLMDNYSSVKIGKTQAQRKLFFNLRKTKEKLRKEGLPSHPQYVALQIGVKTDEVEEMEMRMMHQDQSLNAPYGKQEQGQMVDNLETEGMSVEEQIAGRQLSKLLRNQIAEFEPYLTRREQYILNKRIVARKPLTLQKIGEKFGVSRERIRQIEAGILRKLRLYLQTQLPEIQSYLAA